MFELMFLPIDVYVQGSLRDSGNVKSRGRREAKGATPVRHVHTYFPTYNGVTRTHINPTAFLRGNVWRELVVHCSKGRVVLTAGRV